MMKIALMAGLNRREAEFARQAGLRHVVWSAAGTERGYVTYEELSGARDFFQSYGLELGVIENVAFQYYDQAMLGLPGRDRQIENFCRTLENMGRAGIPVLGYHWMALGGLTTDYVRVRGGALHRHFDMADALRSPAATMEWRGAYHPGRVIHLPDREIGAEEMWGNLSYFLERVLPAAESAGVRLAAHPDDAPIPEFMGVARVLSSFEGFKRLIETFPSPANGIDFCQGTFSEMTGLNVLEAIRYFGSRGRIHFAHFRDTCGKVPVFSEVFMDDGDTDMAAAVRAFNEVGFDGLIRADHAPHIPGDNRHGHASFAFQLGYMRGMFQAVEYRAAQTKEG